VLLAWIAVSSFLLAVAAACEVAFDPKAFARWNAWMHARGSAKMVTRAGRRYLERRYLVAVRNFAAFLHTFWMDDPDPLHDHPWWWGRIILSGRYREHYIDGTFQDCGPGHVVWLRDPRTLHRVELLTESCTTIFWRWRRVRPWGFLEPTGWRPTTDKDSDGRPYRGIVFPRKVGAPPKEIVL